MVSGGGEWRRRRLVVPWMPAPVRRCWALGAKNVVSRPWVPPVCSLPARAPVFVTSMAPGGLGDEVFSPQLRAISRGTMRGGHREQLGQVAAHSGRPSQVCLCDITQLEKQAMHGMYADAYLYQHADSRHGATLPRRLTPACRPPQTCGRRRRRSAGRASPPPKTAPGTRGW